MKKLNWMIPIALAIFDLLFYKQIMGLNCTIFSCVLIVLSMLLKPSLLKDFKWVLIAAATFITALCTGIYGDTLSVLTNLISVCILAAFLTDTGISIPTALSGSIITYIISPYTVVKSWIDSLDRWQATRNHQGYVKIWLTALSIGITMLFFFIYRSSSLMFYTFTQKINLDFISFFWIVFTLNGYLLINSFFSFSNFAWMHQTIDIPGKTISKPDSSLTPQKIRLENYTGTLLLLLLNTLLLVVNLVDFNYLISGQLPAGVTYTTYVHQGVGMLIFSIVLAISIILFFFRNNLNFYQNNRWLKLFAYAWIIQNGLMVISTISRNNLYIEAFGLTEKRIGVYVYLLLIIVGLITTLLKIHKIYSNAHLFRINAWTLYLLLIISCVINWDGLIIHNNLARKDAVANFDYLTELSNSNIPQLLDFEKTQTTKNSKDSLFDTIKISKLHTKLFHFIEKQKDNAGWQSFIYKENEAYHSILNTNIKKLYLYRTSIDHPRIMHDLKNLEELEIINCKSNYLYELGSLTNLKKLTLNNKRACNLSFLSKMKNLEYLDITHNDIMDYAPIYNLQHLKTLIVDNCDEKTMNDLKLHLPYTKLIAN